MDDDEDILQCVGDGCTRVITGQGQPLCASCFDKESGYVDDNENSCQECKQMPSDAESQMCRSCLQEERAVFLGRKRGRPTKTDDPPPAKCPKVDDILLLAVPLTNDGIHDRFYLYTITPQKSLQPPVYSSQSESDGESGAESDDGGTIDRRLLRIEDFPDDSRVVRTFRWSKKNEKSCTVDEFRQHFAPVRHGDLNDQTRMDIITAAEKICEQKAKEKLAWIVEEILHRNPLSVDDVLAQVHQHYLPCFRRYFPFDKDSVQSVLNTLMDQCKVQSVKSEYSPKRPRKSRILPTVKTRVLRPLDSLLHGVHDACLCRQRVVY